MQINIISSLANEFTFDTYSCFYNLKSVFSYDYANCFHYFLYSTFSYFMENKYTFLLISCHIQNIIIIAS